MQVIVLHTHTHYSLQTHKTHALQFIFFSKIFKLLKYFDMLIKTLKKKKSLPL